ncbi:MAG: hypothetical protein GKR98_05990 [Boseongicola sp.]|nr:MAG: hypothetical protein GKR98_05990 [Boseongicola sp.]
MAIVFVLSACSAGDDGSFLIDPLVTEAIALATKSDGLTVSASLPGVDGVAMNGIMVLSDNLDTTGEHYIGDFTATANFASGNISGVSTDFVVGLFDPDGNPTGPQTSVGGSITTGSIALTPGSVLLVHAGNLEINSLTEIVTGSGTGSFLGADGDMFLSNGTLTSGTSTTTFLSAIIAD